MKFKFKTHAWIDQEPFIVALNVFFTLSIPFSVANVIMGLLIYKISTLVTMNMRIIAG